MAYPPGPSLNQITDAIIPTISIAFAGSVVTGSISVLSVFYIMRRKIKPEDSAGLNGSSLASANNLALFYEYHSVGLRQSSFSFYLSIWAAVVGFVIICGAIILALWQYGSQPVDMSSTLSKPSFVLIAGAVVEAVASLFFVQSNRTRTTMTAFFDKLRADRKLDEALSLVNNVSNTDYADRLRMMLSMRFAEVESTDSVLNDLPAKRKSTPDVAGRSE